MSQGAEVEVVDESKRADSFQHTRFFFIQTKVRYGSTITFAVEGRVLKAMASSPRLMENTCSTPDRSPTATFWFFLASEMGNICASA